MKNKILLFVVPLLLCFSNLNAQFFTVDYDGYTMEFVITSPNSVEISSCDGNSSGNPWFIPETVTDNTSGIEYTVVGIGEDVFRKSKVFDGVLTFPNSITKIGYRAFENANIEGVLIIGDNVESIDEKAFAKTDVESLIIKSKHLTEIYDETFSECESLSEVILSDGIEIIGNEAFSECAIEELILPSSLIEIGDAAFYCCPINKLTLPNNLETIGDDAFSECEIAELILPSSLVEIGNDTFSYCANLKKIVFPSSNSRLKLGRRAFYKHSNGGLSVIFSRYTPPTISDALLFHNSTYIAPTLDVLKIYVPALAYEDYITENNWSTYKNNIISIPTFIKDGSLNNAGNWIPNGIHTNASLTDPVNGIFDNTEDVFVFIGANAVIEPREEYSINSFVYCENGSIRINQQVIFDMNIRDEVVISGQLTHNKSDYPVTISRNIDAYVIEEPDENGDIYLKRGWHTISSPFGEVPVHTSILQGGYQLHRYDEPTSEWQNNFNTFEAGRGYIYAHKEGINIELTDIANTDREVTYNITAQGEELTGFNLIGNPFMHNINKFENIVRHNMGKLTDGYYSLTNDGAWTAKLDRKDPIAPFQGILVRTIKEGPLTIHNINNRDSKRSTVENYISIKVANENYKDVAYVTFDGGISLDKINHRNNEVPMIYIPMNNTNYAISVMDKEETTEIPVSFRAMTMGEYSISIETNISDYTEMTLIDKQNGEKTNMLLEESYSFLATSNDYPERFILRVSTKAHDAVIYTKDNNIIVNNMKGSAHIDIYDITGRFVARKDSHDVCCMFSTEGMTAGMYIVHLTDDNGTKVQKVVVKH